jgi:hypothetical protein
MREVIKSSDILLQINFMIVEWPNFFLKIFLCHGDVWPALDMIIESRVAGGNLRKRTCCTLTLSHSVYFYFCYTSYRSVCPKVKTKKVPLVLRNVKFLPSVIPSCKLWYWEM